MPRRRGGLSRGAVGRSRTRRQPSDHWIRCSPGAHRPPVPRKNVAHLVGGPPKRWARRSPPAGGPDPPWPADAARGSAAVGADPLQQQGPRWIEHPLQPETTRTGGCHGLMSIPFCNDLQQDGQSRFPRRFHLCIVWESGQPLDRGARAPPTHLPRGTDDNASGPLCPSD